MSRSDLLERYARMARRVGTDVQIITADLLPDRLASILSELAPSPGIAALPASGWPEGMRESIETILASSGFDAVMPQQSPEGYAWDRDRLAGASIGITWIPAFLADTGSLVLPAGPGMGTLASLLPEIHLALSFAAGCRAGLADYLNETGATLPSRLTLATGPSRTGDIEATMTPGVHGPRTVVHLILENSEQ